MIEGDGIESVDKLRSVLWASKAYATHPKRLGKLLAQRGYLRMGEDGVGRFIWSEASAAFLGDLRGAMSLRQAGIYINAPRPHERLLMDAGLLVPFVVGGAAGIKDHAFSRRELDGFLDRLLKGAKSDIVGLHSIPAAAKRASCSAVEIVRLVMVGKLNRLGLDGSETGFMSLLVDADEVLPLVRREDHGGLSLRQVEQELGTTTAVVSALIGGGFLASEQQVNPVKRTPQTVVMPEVLAEFRSTYVSLHDLALSAGRNPGALRREMEDADTSAAFEGVPAAFYRRDQLG